MCVCVCHFYGFNAEDRFHVYVANKGFLPLFFFLSTKNIWLNLKWDRSRQSKDQRLTQKKSLKCKFFMAVYRTETQSRTDGSDRGLGDTDVENARNNLTHAQ